MKATYEQYLVSPTTHRPLRYDAEGRLANEEEAFEVLCQVPVLLGQHTAADWHRELIECLLWQFPHEIEQLYGEIDWASPTSPTEVYSRWMRKLPPSVFKAKGHATGAFRRMAPFPQR